MEAPRERHISAPSSAKWVTRGDDDGINRGESDAEAGLLSISTTTTRFPARASFHAAQRPVSHPPITATSTTLLSANEEAEAEVREIARRWERTRGLKGPALLRNGRDSNGLGDPTLLELAIIIWRPFGEFLNAQRCCIGYIVFAINSRSVTPRFCSAVVVWRF